MSVHCEVTVAFPIYAQFGAEQSGSCIPERMVFKTYIFINSNLLSYKNWKQNKKISNGSLILLLWVKVLFFRKNDDILEKNADISKIEWLFILGGICSETAYMLYLRIRFKVSSSILMSKTAKPTPKKPTQIS